MRPWKPDLWDDHGASFWSSGKGLAGDKSSGAGEEHAVFTSSVALVNIVCNHMQSHLPFVSQELLGASVSDLEKASRLWYQSLSFRSKSSSDIY